MHQCLLSLGKGEVFEKKILTVIKLVLSLWRFESTAIIYLFINVWQQLLWRDHPAEKVQKEKIRRDLKWRALWPSTFSSQSKCKWYNSILSVNRTRKRNRKILWGSIHSSNNLLRHLNKLVLQLYLSLQLQMLNHLWLWNRKPNSPSTITPAVWWRIYLCLKLKWISKARRIIIFSTQSGQATSSIQ